MEKSKLYTVERNLLLFSFVTVGFGYHIGGVAMPLEYSTFLIFLVLLMQIITNTLKISRIFLALFVFVFIQTFIINPTNLSNPNIFSHFVGLALLSLTIFSFITNYSQFLDDFVIKYYKLVYYIALFSIVQISVFVIFNVSILPQNFITGQISTTSGEVLDPEMFGFLPRNLGLSSEPANFAFILMPGTYLALSQLLTRNSLIKLPTRYAWIIILAKILTFSSVAYFGLVMASIFLFKKASLFNTKAFLLIVLTIPIFVFVILNTPVGIKVLNLAKISLEVSQDSELTYDITAFALVSNFMVAKTSQIENKYIGSGLNTHVYNYDKYLYSIFSRESVVLELNKNGGGSIFIRILSEFGVVGLSLFIILLYKYKIRKNKSPFALYSINEMSLVTLLLYCTRSDHFISITFIMFLGIYLSTYNMYKNIDRRSQFTRAT